MRTYAKSCVRRKSFYSKSELQMLMLSLISGGHICVSKLLYDFAFEQRLVGHILNKIMVIWFFKPAPFS